MKLPHTLLITCLGAATLCAQQVAPKTEVKQAEKSASASGEASASATVTTNSNGNVKTETRTADSRSNRRPQQPNQPPPGAEQKPVAYIGVLTREVPPELRSQFSLPEGFGLLVEEVMPDSPAQHAGLKVYDLLVKFEDQQLVSMEQLMLLVRAKKKGDVVNLTVISGGKESQVPVTLGEKQMPTMQQRQQHGFSGGPQNGAPMFNGEDFRGFPKQGNEMAEQMQRFQQEMREYQQRIQDWSKGGGNTPMPQPPNFNVPGGAGGQQHQRGDRHNGPQPQQGNAPRPDGVQFQTSIDAHTAMNITRRDDAGEYSIKREDGQTTFTVRPNNGKEQSWPVNNDAERKAVPEEFRDKLRMMDGAGSGIHIELRPGPGGEVPGNPGPRDGGGNPAQPRPKGRTTSV